MKIVLFDLFGVICNPVLTDWGKRHLTKEDQARRLPALGDSVDVGKISLREFHETLSELSGLSIKQVRKGLLVEVTLNPYIISIIERLRDRITLGILSNVSSDFLADLLAEQHLSGHFDPVFASSTLGVAKPDPKIFVDVTKKLGYQPEEIFFVDDNATNIAVAGWIGWSVHHFTSHIDLETRFRELGLL